MKEVIGLLWMHGMKSTLGFLAISFIKNKNLLKWLLGNGTKKFLDTIKVESMCLLAKLSRSKL